LAKVSQRFFAIFFAVLFLITSSSVAVLFILSNIQSKDNAKGATKSATSQTTTPTNQGTLSGFTPVASVTQLEAKNLTVGTGATVKAGDTLSVTYTGAVAATGEIFQSATSPISISLSEVIVGWQEGIPGMKVGGTRELLIPAALAYGASPPSDSGIPANAALVFNVTVKAITSS
jgi:FKBP-type peptidyl-prolyl cis-trans isomerase